jgi:predicted Fe-Mo cluster-binding NifX family protein
MRVAIAASDARLDSGIHYNFGQSPSIVIFDSTTGETTTIQNRVGTAASRTGTELARLLVEHKVDKVAAGMFGARVERVFSESGIQMEIVTEKTVDEYIRSSTDPSGGVTKPSPRAPAQTPRSNDEPGRIERGSCFCSGCGYSTQEDAGVPCFQRHCPNCKTPLERKF